MRRLATNKKLFSCRNTGKSAFQKVHAERVCAITNYGHFIHFGICWKFCVYWRYKSAVGKWKIEN